jgi:hypothetical protein
MEVLILGSIHGIISECQFMDTIHGTITILIITIIIIITRETSITEEGTTQVTQILIQKTTLILLTTTRKETLETTQQLLGVKEVQLIETHLQDAQITLVTKTPLNIM